MSYQQIKVPHLFSTMGVFSTQHDRSKPTLFMMPSFGMAFQIFDWQYNDQALLEKMNLVCVEPLGQGGSKAGAEHVGFILRDVQQGFVFQEVELMADAQNSTVSLSYSIRTDPFFFVSNFRNPKFTYWDTALCSLQVLSHLEIPRVFALGMSQGGWIVTRMALLKPEVIKGLIILGSSMDYESKESVERGCWNIHESFTPIIEHLSKKDDNFQPPDSFLEAIYQSGLGSAATPEFKASWTPRLRDIYKGDEGRRRLRVISINLRDRDTLYGRLSDIHQPIIWLQGTEDRVYSVKQAENDFKLFSNSKGTKLKIIQEGQHFLAASNPSEVNRETIDFVEKWNSRIAEGHSGGKM